MNSSFLLLSNLKPSEKINYSTLKVIHDEAKLYTGWVHNFVSQNMFLNSRNKPLKMLNFCRNDQKNERTKEEQRSVLVAESADISQNAQFGLVMFFGENSEIFFVKFSTFSLKINGGLKIDS